MKNVTRKVTRVTLATVNVKLEASGHDHISEKSPSRQAPGPLTRSHPEPGGRVVQVSPGLPPAEMRVVRMGA